VTQDSVRSKGASSPHSPLPAHSGMVSPAKDNYHHTFRSISRSSASSASSSGSHVSRPGSQNDDRQIRSDTRTMNKPPLHTQMSNGSDRSSPDWDNGKFVFMSV
jgi:hypothetical protein